MGIKKLLLGLVSALLLFLATGQVKAVSPKTYEEIEKIFQQPEYQQQINRGNLTKQLNMQRLDKIIEALLQGTQSIILARALAFSAGYNFQFLKKYHPKFLVNDAALFPMIIDNYFYSDVQDFYSYNKENVSLEMLNDKLKAKLQKLNCLFPVEEPSKCAVL
ncbi:MAG: hypothetical protein LBT69_02095 [Lactobacillales bacterium]|jgi:hypothetical protein|nr:hypothetical protein [Lactobacillales bacterium]